MTAREPYPLPHHAASVWLAGDRLMLSLPPTGDNERGHTIPLPADERGFAFLISTLRAREVASTPSLIGTKGAPTEHDYRQWLKAFKGTVTRIEPKRVADENLGLEDLGL